VGEFALMNKGADFARTLATANNTAFGRWACICTWSVKHVIKFYRVAKTGIMMVNLLAAGVHNHVPFRGTNGESQRQKEQGSCA
jgi:acyl-CoA reductase-like NAD-dependent aldehyde dehydrogenase